MMKFEYVSAMVSKPYHHGDLYEQLLHAGEQALAEMPIEKVSLREIARRAGVSHAAPKHHFPTTGHLLGEIAAKGYQVFVKALGEAADQASEQTPRERLHAMGRAYQRFAEHHKAAYQLMFGGAGQCAMTPNLVAASFAAWKQLHDSVLPLVGPARANAAALHIWSASHGLAMLKLAQRLPPFVARHNVEEQELQMMLAGLEAE
jgi:AcrR family transcriptional regulator